MEEEFVPYEIALAMKELGFSELCFGWYSEEEKKLYPLSSHDKQDTPDVCLAPIYQQAFRWFRSKYNGFFSMSKIDFLVEFTIDGKFIRSCSTQKENRIFRENGNTYEEVQEACIKRIIEIIKEESNTYQ